MESSLLKTSQVSLESLITDLKVSILLRFAAIMNRFTLHCETATQMHTRELVFEPFDAQYQRDSGSEPGLLRARKELLEPDAKWYVLNMAQI